MGNIKENKVEMFCLNCSGFEICTGFNGHLNKPTLTKDNIRQSLI